MRGYLWQMFLFVHILDALDVIRKQLVSFQNASWPSFSQEDLVPISPTFVNPILNLNFYILKVDPGSIYLGVKHSNFVQYLEPMYVNSGGLLKKRWEI